MPAPPSLTGIPGDSSRDLPNPQSYDTSAVDVVVDGVTHLTWQRGLSREVLTWSAAERYCADLDLGGRDDWRLPSRIELVSLIDFTRGQEYNISAAFSDALPVHVWTCTPGPANPLAAWFVDFYNGGVFPDDKSGAKRARCVAGTTFTNTPPPARYDRGTPGEVKDLKTLLTWRAAPLAGVVNWGQAYEGCRDLGAGWRLPSVTELQTLIDETQGESAVDPTAFADRPDAYFWTSSFIAGNTYAWFVSIGAGNTYWIPTSELIRARCVR